MIVEIEIVGYVNVIITAETISHPCRPSASQYVAGFYEGFGQDNSQSVISTGAGVAHKLSVGRIHPYSRLKSDVGTVASV